jgi:hypothetical protein
MVMVRRRPKPNAFDITKFQIINPKIVILAIAFHIDCHPVCGTFPLLSLRRHFPHSFLTESGEHDSANETEQESRIPLNRFLSSFVNQFPDFLVRFSTSPQYSVSGKNFTGSDTSSIALAFFLKFLRSLAF